MDKEQLASRAYALVGAARQDFGSVKLEDLPEHIAIAIERGQWVTLGFYDCGYPEPVEFWPEKVEDDEGFHRTSMMVFSGGIGSIAPRFPACLIISQHAGGTEAAITYVPLLPRTIGESELEA